MVLNTSKIVISNGKKSLVEYYGKTVLVDLMLEQVSGRELP